MTYLHDLRPLALVEKARIQDELPSAIKTTLHFHFASQPFETTPWKMIIVAIWKPIFASKIWTLDGLSMQKSGNEKEKQSWEISWATFDLKPLTF